VKAFFEDENGQIWIATDGGGLNHFDINTGRFNRINTANSNISSNAILCLQKGDNNQIWMGTWAGGLVNYNTKTKKFKSYNTKNSQISDDNIHSIAKDSKGNLWMGSQNGGLIHFDVKNNKFKIYLPENSGISNKRISAVNIDNNDQIYLAATDNMQIFNPHNTQFTTYESNTNDPYSISNNYVIDILVQNDTCVWIGSGVGLNRFNPLNKSFTKYFEGDGLPNNLINGITLDKSEKLWITTGYGLCLFDYKNNKFTNFSKTDGLQSNEFVDRSILALKNGKILMGGVNGFNIISPGIVPVNNKIPEVGITGFSIFNKPVPIGNNCEVLTKQISETKEIKIKYDQSVLTFNFAVLDFTNTLKNQYAYMMEGFDTDWIYSGNRSDATYTNLNPGKYIFRVKGANNQGVWNETGTSLVIRVKPPWWKTNIAIASYIIITVSLLLGLYYIRVNNLYRQKKILKKLVDKRTVELALKNEIVTEANQLLKERQDEIEQKNITLIEQAEQLNETNTLMEERQQLIEEQSEELIVQKEDLIKQRDALNELNATKDKLFSILGHDLRSPFNVIIGFSDLLFRNIRNYPIEKTEFQIGAIKDAALNTYNLLNNLLEWSRSQSGKIRFEPVKIMVSELLANELNILLQQASKKEVEIKLTTTDNENLIDGDPDLLSTVMRNLISNAIKFSHKNTTVEISLNLSQNDLTFSVKDHGIGMSSRTIDKLFNVNTNTSTRGTNDEKGAGLGLLLCKDFIDKHNGTIWAESQQDLGSTFSFTIPVKQ
jgi:signal transduction histidine kinase/streptogramin lyase